MFSIRACEGEGRRGVSMKQCERAEGFSKHCCYPSGQSFYVLRGYLTDSLALKDNKKLFLVEVASATASAVNGIPAAVASLFRVVTNYLCIF